jgi:hypothetical protein
MPSREHSSDTFLLHSTMSKEVQPVIVSAYDSWRPSQLEAPAGGIPPTKDQDQRKAQGSRSFRLQLFRRG